MTQTSSRKQTKLVLLLLSLALTASFISCASVEWESPNSADSPLVVNAGSYSLPLTILADSMFPWPIKLKSNDTRFAFQSGFYITYQATYANDIMGVAGNVAPGLYVINYTLDNSSWRGPGLLYIEVSTTPIDLYIDPILTLSYGTIAGPTFNLVSLSPWSDVTVSASVSNGEFTVSPSSITFRPNSTSQGFMYSTNSNTKSTSSATITYTLSGTNKATYALTQAKGIVNVPGGSNTSTSTSTTTTPTSTTTTPTNTTTTPTSTTTNTTSTTNTTRPSTSTTNTSSGGFYAGGTGGSTANNNTNYWNFSTDTSDWFDLGDDSTSNVVGNLNQTASGGTSGGNTNTTPNTTTPTNTTTNTTTNPTNTTTNTTKPNTGTNTTTNTTTNTSTPNTSTPSGTNTMTFTSSDSTVTIIAGTFSLPLTLTTSSSSFKSNVWLTASLNGFMFNPQLYANAGAISASSYLGCAGTTAAGNYSVTFWSNNTAYPAPSPLKVKVTKGTVKIPRPDAVTVKFVNGFTASSVPVVFDLSDYPPWSDVIITPKPSDSNWIVFPAQVVLTAAVKSASFVYQVKPSAKGNFTTNVTFAFSGTNAASYAMAGNGIQTLKGVGKAK